MNAKRIVTLLGLFCLFSCTPLGSGLRIEGDALVCDRPELVVHFKKAIANIQENDSRRIITFKGGDPRPLLIEIHRVPHSTKIDYFYSLPHIASSMNHYYLDTVKFGEREWAKTSFFDKKGCLYCSYFTLKDNDFIFITICNQNIGKDGVEAFNEYSKTLEMSKRALIIIDKQFDYLNEVAEIRL